MMRDKRPKKRVSAPWPHLVLHRTIMALSGQNLNKYLISESFIMPDWQNKRHRK